jgi:hypothetical protein
VYDYITKLCRTQANVILNRENPNVRGSGQTEARHGKYERLKFGGYAMPASLLVYERIKTLVIDLEETEVRNNSADEGQEQFYRPTCCLGK